MFKFNKKINKMMLLKNILIQRESLILINKKQKYKIKLLNL